MALTLYGFYGSFCTQKVRLALAEKGVEATWRPVNIGPPMENYEPWYARLNPRMVVPTLDHDGTIVCNSATIIRYVDETFDGPPLMPDDPEQRAEVDAIVDRIDALSIRELSYGNFPGPLARFRDVVIMPRRLKMLRKYKAQAPDLAERYDVRIADVQAWIETIHRPADLARLKSELEDTLAELDGRVCESDFMVGDRYSLADLMATVLCARLRLLKIAALEDYPALGRHYERMRARPRFPADVIAESVDVAKMVRIVGPFLLPRLLLALSVVTALVWLTLRLACG